MKGVDEKICQLFLSVVEGFGLEEVVCLVEIFAESFGNGKKEPLCRSDCFGLYLFVNNVDIFQTPPF